MIGGEGSWLLLRCIVWNDWISPVINAIPNQFSTSLLFLLSFLSLFSLDINTSHLFYPNVLSVVFSYLNGSLFIIIVIFKRRKNFGGSGEAFFPYETIAGFPWPLYVLFVLFPFVEQFIIVPTGEFFFFFLEENEINKKGKPVGVHLCYYIVVESERFRKSKGKRRGDCAWRNASNRF